MIKYSYSFLGWDTLLIFTGWPHTGKYWDILGVLGFALFSPKYWDILGNALFDMKKPGIYWDLRFLSNSTLFCHFDRNMENTGKYWDLTQNILGYTGI